MKNLPIVKSMVRRVIKTPKKHKLQRGGATPLGEDVNSISRFTPSSIPDLALWIKVSPASILKSTIADYIPTQSISVQEDLRVAFANKLDTSVITEIKGVGGSLVRFELESSKVPSFPTYISDLSGNDAISLAYDTDSYKLVTKDYITLENKFSIFSASENVDFNYIPSLSKLVIGANLLAHFNNPVSKFSEIIVYTRELTQPEKQQVEGYLAYINNNQYALPLRHKYLPDMSHLPYLAPIISSIADIETSIAKSTEDLNKAIEPHKEQSETDLALRGKLTAATDDLLTIRQIFSKGALLSKEPKTLDSIFAAANSLNILTVPFAPKYIQYKISDILELLSEVKKYTDDIKAAIPRPETVLAEKEAATQASEIEAAQTQEIFETSQIEIQAHEFYDKLRRRSDAVEENGMLMHGPIYKDFEDKVSVYWDAITYSNKKVKSEWLSLVSVFKPIETQINSRAWLKYIPNIDISESEIIMKGGSVYSVQYRDNYLNTIQTIYQKIRVQMYDGDMAYINAITPLKSSEIEELYKAIQEKKIQPIMIKTFLPHFKQCYNEISNYMEKFTNLSEVIRSSISNIAEALDYSKKNKMLPRLGDFPVIPAQETYRSECDTVYIRKVNQSDAILTGIEYILADAEGNISNSVNVDGEIDNSFMFPKSLKFNKEDRMFFIYHPYKDDNGSPIRQEIKLLDDFPLNKSIIDSLSKSRRPNYWFHKEAFEIPREQINGIHQFAIEGAQYPIQLPKYAIAVGSYFLIQNVGANPIQIQNPGFPDDLIDMIGHGESMLYIYSALKETHGSTYYGRVAWREGYVPYDTLLNSPRSEYSVFVKELGSSIYVKKNLEPILDSDGYFIKVVTDSNGYTYDIDDLYKANPYQIQSMKEVSMSDLKNKGAAISIRKDQPITILKDIITGLPVLCNSKGIPGINEFGFCKFAKSPLMLIDNSIVIRGAFGDIKVTINDTLEIEQMGILEPFLKFDTIYRSKFVQSYAKDTTNTFVFIGLSKYPILSPKNKFIETEMWSLMPPHEITYVDVSGKTGVAYISPTTIKDSPIAVAPYPYISVQDRRLQIEMKKASKIILRRYVTDKKYIINCLDSIKKTATDSVGLGKIASERIQSNLTSATTQIQADYDKYLTYESSIEPIQASLDASVLTESLKIAIDVLDLKMKELIESVAATYNSITDSIENTNKLLNDLNSVETSATELRTKGVVEIEAHIYSLKTTLQTDAQKLKITGSPEFDRLLKLMIKLKMDFIQKLIKLEDSMKARPEYVTEYPPWIKARREEIKELNRILIRIREIEQVDIPRVFSARETNENTKQVQKFNEIINQLRSYTKYKEAVGLWIGIPASPSYDEQKPVFGEPAVKGLSIELNIFNEMTNPSIKRDWASLEAPAEISARIISELLSPTEALKNKYRASFFEDKTPLPEMPNQQGFAEIREAVNGLTERINRETPQLLAFESELAPILKAYESIRAALRADLRNKLEENRKKIQEKWLELTGKRTAMQTLLMQNPDPIKEAELEKQFEIEPRVAELAIDFDDISYFKMKELKETQEDILSKLDDMHLTCCAEVNNSVGVIN